VSKRVVYQEYTISSTPVQLLGKNAWKPEIEISSEREGIVASRPYTDETTYPTEEAADAHGIQLGQDIIEGKAPELSGNYDEKEPFNASTPFTERM
jgi:hypothetical protein